MMDQATRLREMVKEQTVTNNVLKEKAKIITIASGKGGVGKTNVVSNLAIQIQEMGKDVIVIDADFGFANVDVILGVSPRYSFMDLIQKKKNINEILTVAQSGVKFISGASEIQQLLDFNEEQVNYFIEQFGILDEIADYIFIDTGAGITQSALSFMHASDAIILVTTPEPTAITDAYILLKTLKNQNIVNKNDSVVHAIINLVESYTEGEEIFNKLNKVTNKFLGYNLSKLGYIPFDKNVMNSVRKQVPVTLFNPKSQAVYSMRQIADNLVNNKFNEKSFRQRGIQSFLTSLIKRK